MSKNKRAKKIELLAPAGDLERLKTAVVFGADAVYCGLSDWSMRSARELTFTIETLREGIEFAHARGVKVYLTFNVYPHENQIDRIEKDLKKIKKANLAMDGVVVSDFGTIELIKKILPGTSIHISTQTNTLNSNTVKFWQSMGADRVVLARELTLKEIKKIKKRLGESRGSTSGITPNSNLGASPDVELEVFGHGAMCMAYSGRCLLSKYFTGREANLGDCAQSCRWRYKVRNEKNSVGSGLNPEPQMQHQGSEFNSEPTNKDKYFLEEETRPGDLLEVQEDENGTYFMNSKEICSLDILDKFIEAGIDSLKVEGRAKTVYYLATVIGAYRRAIDKYYELSSKQVSKNTYKNTIKELYKELDLVQNRGYSHGFLLGRHGYEQEYKIAAFKPPVLFLGVVQGTKDGYVEIEVKNKFKVGDKIEVVTPAEVLKGKVLEIKDKNGKVLEEILKPAERVWVRFNIKEKISERSILRKRIHPVK